MLHDIYHCRVTHLLTCHGDYITPAKRLQAAAFKLIIQAAPLILDATVFQPQITRFYSAFVL